MPYKDPEKRKASMKAWRERTISQGYGKWLYARRKLRFDDAERFREALQMIADMEPTSSAGLTAQHALDESLEAEEALGQWEPPTS